MVEIRSNRAEHRCFRLAHGRGHHGEQRRNEADGAEDREGGAGRPRAAVAARLGLDDPVEGRRRLLEGAREVVASLLLLADGVLPEREVGIRLADVRAREPHPVGDELERR